VLYEVLSGTAVGALQAEGINADEMAKWLDGYRGYPVLATLSDGEDTLIAAMKQVWPTAPHQRCQEHFLGNVAEEILVDEDTQLRQGMRESLGGLPKVKKTSSFI
jgi:transposase-like protein